MSFLVLFIDYKIYTLPSFSHFSIHTFISRKQKTCEDQFIDGICGEVFRRIWEVLCSDSKSNIVRQFLMFPSGLCSSKPVCSILLQKEWEWTA